MPGCMSRRLYSIAAVWCISILPIASAFTLGIDHSKQVGPTALAVVKVDPQGNVYLMANDHTVQKRAAGGDLVWQAGFDFAPITIAVDSAGNVYALPSGPTSTAFVAKLNADGTPAPSRLVLGTGLAPFLLAIAQDDRIWVAGNTRAGVANTLPTTLDAFQRTAPNTTSAHCFLVRLSPGATAIEYASYLSGQSDDSARRIAVDGTGAVLLSGSTMSTDFPLTTGSGTGAFLTRLNPAIPGLVYSIIAPGVWFGSIAVDAAGNVSIIESIVGSTPKLAHFSPRGTLLFSKDVPKEDAVLATDPAGNTYAVWIPLQGNYTAAPGNVACGSVSLNVFSPSGDVLQSMWLPVVGGYAPQSIGGPVAVAVDGNSNVYVLASIFTPAPVAVLTRATQEAGSRTAMLGCLTDAAIFQVPGGPIPTSNQPFFYASNRPSGIAAGEIVSLFGKGLGPANGVHPAIMGAGHFPTDLSGVQVLFDNQPAALLYVQEGQVNAVVPWSTTGPTTEVCVVANGTKTNCLIEPVVVWAPAVFTVDGTYAAAINQDGSLNSQHNPAPLGSVVTVFATGLGPIVPPVEDGAIVTEPLPANQFAVTANSVSMNGIFGGVQYTDFDLAYYGPAPLEIAGLSQISVKLPPGEFSLPTPAAQDIYLHVAGVVAKFTFFAGANSKASSPVKPPRGVPVQALH